MRMKAEPAFSLYVLKGTQNDMDVKISGGTITHNYSGTGENIEENAIILMGMDNQLTESGFADIITILAAVR